MVKMKNIISEMKNIRLKSKRIEDKAKVALSSDTAVNAAKYLTSFAPPAAREVTVKYFDKVHEEETAIAEAARWTKEQKTNPEAWRRFGFLLQKAKRFEEAIEAYEKVLLYSSKSDLASRDFAFYNQGLSDEALGRYTSAISKFWEVSEASTLRNKALLRITACLDNGGASLADKRVALTQITSEIQDLKIHEDLAIIEKLLGNDDDALRVLEEADSFQPLTSRALYLKAQLLEAAGEISKAKREYDRALACLPKNKKVFGLGALHSHHRNWGAALDAFDSEAAVRDNKPDDYLYEKGVAAESADQWEAAVGSYSAALAFNSNRRYTAFRLAVCLERSGEINQAIEAYQYSASINGQDKHGGFYHAGRLLNSLKEYQQACLCFFNDPLGDDWCIFFRDHEIVRARNFPGLSGTLCNQSKLNLFELEAKLRYLLQLGDYEPALKLAKEMVFRSTSHSPSGCWLVGSLLYRLGEYEDACRYYLRMRVPRCPYIERTPKPKKGLPSRLDDYIAYREGLPIQPHTVLYEVGHGSSISCNPLAIYRRMQERFPESDWRHVWVVDGEIPAPRDVANAKNVVIVQRETDRYFRELATAKYLINNTSFGSYFVRRPGQRYVNTWHGTPIKTLGDQVKGEFLTYGNISRNLLQCTDLAVGNEWTAEVMLKDFGVKNLFSGQLLTEGVARIDELVTLSEDAKEQHRIRLVGAAEERPILLYAPTWRGEVNTDIADSFNLEAELQVIKLMEASGYRVFYSAHRFVKELAVDSELSRYLLPPGTNSYDVMPLIDVLVTDYSSIFFDYLALRKPVVFYTYDLDEYLCTRGLYDISFPGPVCRDLSEFQVALETLRNGIDEFQTEREKFIEKYLPNEDGRACDRIIDKMIAPLPRLNVDDPAFVFRLSFLPNGIASSFRALGKELAEEHGNGAVIAFTDRTALLRDETRLEQFSLLDENIKVLPRAGGILLNAEEKYLDDMRNSGDWALTTRQREVLDAGYRREWQRSFGQSRPEASVEFDGYTGFWAHIMGSAPESTSKVIYLHNEMEAERKTKHPQLDVVFEDYRLFDRAISVSESVASANEAYLVKKGMVVNSQPRFTWANNLLDSAKIEAALEAPLPQKVQELVKEGEEYIVIVARLSIEKAHLRTLEAYSEISKDERKKLVLVGEGPQRPVLEQRIRDLGLDDDVFLVGFLKNPLGVVLHARSLGLLSKWEGQGLTLLEAMAIGVPVVATDIPGPRSIISEFGGLIVENSLGGVKKGLQLMSSSSITAVDFDWKKYNRQALAKFESICE